MSRWLGILLIIIFVLVSPCTNMDLNITRGSTDKFTNPRCFGGLCTKSSMSMNCDGLNGAYCISQNCFECECNATNPTFYHNEYSDGECVKNEKISVSLADSHSFLAKHSYWGRCMVPLFSDKPGLTVDTCDVSNTRQRWIWTKNNQMLNLYTLKCLQTSEIPIFQGIYPKVSLTPCNASDSKQIWECRPIRGTSQKNLIHLKYEKAYLNFGNVPKYVIVFSGDREYSFWKRYQSGQPLCSFVSTYHGCYKYSDGSSMFTIKTEVLNECANSSAQCEERKDVLAPIEVTNHHCSIRWEKTEFLNYSRWSYLPTGLLEKKPFYLEKRNSTTITLKVKLAASQHLRGQIIRLYIRCENTMTSKKQGENETHCVLIKFSGNFESLFSVQLSSTAQTSRRIMSTLSLPTTGSETQTGKSFLTTLSTIFKENETTLPTHGSSLSTAVTIIIVCVSTLLLLLVFAAIILFVVFKQGRCCMKKTQKETTNDLYESKTMQSANSGASLNPIYSCSNIRTSFPTDIAMSPNGHELPVKSACSESVLYESNTFESNFSENIYYECAANMTTSHPVPDDQTQ